MATLEADGLLSVKSPPSGSLSFQADYLARQHPADLSDVRDFYDLSQRYYNKLLADQYPDIEAAKQRQSQERG
jgi:hypothetical protein